MKNISLYLSLLFILLLTSCSDDGDLDDDKNNNLTGYFLDSAVQGVDYYRHGIKRGTTDSEGKFTYRSRDDNITFKIGKLILKENFSMAETIDNKVIPSDLVGVARTNISNDEVIKILQILQSLDDDGNPNNGIKITNDIALRFTENIKIESQTINEIVGKTRKTVVSKEKAKNHFKKTLRARFNLNVGLIFTSNTAFSVKENEAITITLKAADDNNSTITYTLSEGDSALFNNNAGVITFKTVPDFEQKLS